MNILQHTTTRKHTWCHLGGRRHGNKEHARMAGVMHGRLRGCLAMNTCVQTAGRCTFVAPVRRLAGGLARALAYLAGSMGCAWLAPLRYIAGSTSCRSSKQLLCMRSMPPCFQGATRNAKPRDGWSSVFAAVTRVIHKRGCDFRTQSMTANFVRNPRALGLKPSR